MLGEEAGDSLKMPDISSLETIILQSLPTLAAKELEIIKNLFVDIFNKVTEWLKGTKTFDSLVDDLFGDTFWTIFDSIELLVVSGMEILAKLFDALQTVLLGEWKFPIVSDEWEEFAEQKLSILGSVTMIAAYVMNFSSFAMTGKMPFEDNPHAADQFLIEEKDLDLFGTLLSWIPADLDGFMKEKDGQVSTSMRTVSVKSVQPVSMVAESKPIHVMRESTSESGTGTDGTGGDATNTDDGTSGTGTDGTGGDTTNAGDGTTGTDGSTTTDTTKADENAKVSIQQHFTISF